MKSLIIFSTVLFTCLQFSNAAVLTVSNDPVDNAEYATLQTAYDAAINGDTLHLQGTNIAYYLNSCSSWNKALTVIGIGFNAAKQNPKRTFISTTCYDVFRIGNNASNSQFHGIVFLQRVIFYSSLSNIVFEECEFNVDVHFFCKTVTNFTFRNCVFNRDNSVNILLGCNSAVQSGIFQNCIFDGYIDGYLNTLADISFDHCLFLRFNSSFLNLYYAQISNCIFMNAFPVSTYNSDYQNNLCRVSGTFPPEPGNGNTASGNIENQDPQFVNYTLGNYYSKDHDYHTQAGSPAENAGNDGTDIGLHGGTSGFSEQGEVLINPIVREVNIQNTTVDPNGTLNVHIKATTPDND